MRQPPPSPEQIMREWLEGRYQSIHRLSIARLNNTNNMQTFQTGATRNSSEHKIDPEGFLSPRVIQAFSDYMNSHRVQADGSVRSSDNWQKGITMESYMKSMWRHFLDVWSINRGIARFDETGREIDLEEALCATLFNVQGMLHEELKRKGRVTSKVVDLDSDVVFCNICNKGTCG